MPMMHQMENVKNVQVEDVLNEQIIDRVSDMNDVMNGSNSDVDDYEGYHYESEVLPPVQLVLF